MSHTSKWLMALAAVALICSTASASLLDVKAISSSEGAPGTFTGPGTYGISADGKTVNLHPGDTVTFDVSMDLSSLAGITNGLQTAYLSFRTGGYDSTGAADAGVGADRFGVADFNSVDGTLYPATSDSDSVISYVSSVKSTGSPLESFNPQTLADQLGAGSGWGALSAMVGVPLGLPGNNQNNLLQAGPVSTNPHPGAYMTSGGTSLMQMTYTVPTSATAGTASRRTWLNAVAGTAFPDPPNQGSSSLALLTTGGASGGPSYNLVGADLGAPVVVGVNITAVPEPGTFAMLIVGGLGLLFVRRRFA